MTSDPDEEAIDDLYRGPREAFIEARNALADRLQVRGDGAAAERVRALRKPSVSAWAVNQLWWFERDAYDALHAAGAALLELQRTGASIAGQPANEARRAALDRLRRLAAERLREAGHAASVATLRKVSHSLEASAAGGSFGAEGPLGRLHTELSTPSFGEIARFAPPGTSQARPTPARRAATELERARAARELADATAVLQAAERSAADAEAALRRAQRTFDDAHLALERARTRHRAAASQDASVRARAEALEREEP